MKWKRLRSSAPRETQSSLSEQSDPVFVVNICDCLSELTRGALKSTVHRVAEGAGDSPRHCLAMFFGFDADAVLPSGVSYGAWRHARVERALACLRGQGGEGPAEGSSPPAPSAAAGSAGCENSFLSRNPHTKCMGTDPTQKA